MNLNPRLSVGVVSIKPENLLTINKLTPLSQSEKILHN